MPEVDIPRQSPIPWAIAIQVSKAGIKRRLGRSLITMIGVVLAIILMRKRRLKYDSGTNEGGQDIWRLRVTGEKRIVRVINPQLTEEQIEQLSGQISEILQVEM